MDQEGLSWFWKAGLVLPPHSPSHPSVGPLGFGMVADPKVSQDWAEAGAWTFLYLRSFLYSAPLL